jgi:hypothetical protein
MMGTKGVAACGMVMDIEQYEMGMAWGVMAIEEVQEGADADGGHRERRVGKRNGDGISRGGFRPR